MKDMRGLVLVLLLTSCVQARPPRRKVQDPGSFRLYRVVESQTASADPRSARLNELALEPTPLLTERDFVRYNWAQHTFTLTPEAARRVPRPGVSGIPFVVVAMGKRIYLGAIWTEISSATFAGPVMIEDKGGWRFDRAYPPGWDTGQTKVTSAEGPLVGPHYFAGADPRSDPLIRQALQRAIRTPRK